MRVWDPYVVRGGTCKPHLAVYGLEAALGRDSLPTPMAYQIRLGNALLITVMRSQTCYRVAGCAAGILEGPLQTPSHSNPCITLFDAQGNLLP